MVCYTLKYHIHARGPIACQIFLSQISNFMHLLNLLLQILIAVYPLFIVKGLCYTDISDVSLFTQLLGELYADKEYLEKLMEDSSRMTMISFFKSSIVIILRIDMYCIFLNRSCSFCFYSCEALVLQENLEFIMAIQTLENYVEFEVENI